MRAPDDPPRSDVSAATGRAGAGALALLLGLVLWTDPAPALGAFLVLAGTAAAMIAWDLLVERVHRNPSAGLDHPPRPAAEAWPIVGTKLVGLVGTWGLVALAYLTLRHYAEPRFDLYFAWLIPGAGLALLLAPHYLLWITRRMREPRDGLWHFGRLLCRGPGEVERDAVLDHLRGWTVKAFFLAFMVSIVPASFGGIFSFPWDELLSEPHAFAVLLIRLLFLYDLVFGTIGYVCSFRVLDAHLRSANPFASAWMAALVCYPPFVLMTEGGPLWYRGGDSEWIDVFAGQDVALVLWGAVLVALAFVYAWATVIFGLRFSNLTHRGIITNGPYRHFKHPAYVSKCLFWWLAYLPFLPHGDPFAALRDALLLGIVCAIYYARARTEEMHLRSDPKYAAYEAWIARNGVFGRLRTALADALGAEAPRPRPVAGGGRLAPGGMAKDEPQDLEK